VILACGVFGRMPGFYGSLIEAARRRIPPGRRQSRQLVQSAVRYTVGGVVLAAVRHRLDVDGRPIAHLLRQRRVAGKNDRRAGTPSGSGRSPVRSAKRVEGERDRGKFLEGEQSRPVSFRAGKPTGGLAGEGSQRHSWYQISALRRGHGFGWAPGDEPGAHQKVTRVALAVVGVVERVASRGGFCFRSCRDAMTLRARAHAARASERADVSMSGVRWCS
jgi:hypothetical protein